MISFKVNETSVNVDEPADAPLMWVLRDQLELTGTKYGCGIGLCGSCTVHIDGQARRSCLVPLSEVRGKSVVTIEGLAPSASQLHPVQQAWIEHDVPQCGYCQAGQIMATVDLLKRIPQPSDRDIDENMTNICRCGTYVRIRKAIHRAAELMKEAG